MILIMKRKLKHNGTREEDEEVEEDSEDEEKNKNKEGLSKIEPERYFRDQSSG